MAIEQPEPQPLQPGKISNAIKSFCSGVTGDCLVFELDAEGRLYLSNTAGDFRVMIAPHELDQFGSAYTATIVRKYGLAGITAIAASASETIEDPIWPAIEEDVAYSNRSRNITGWRDDLAGVHGTG